MREQRLLVVPALAARVDVQVQHDGQIRKSAKQVRTERDAPWPCMTSTKQNQSSQSAWQVGPLLSYLKT